MKRNSVIKSSYPSIDDLRVERMEIIEKLITAFSTTERAEQIHPYLAYYYWRYYDGISGRELIEAAWCEMNKEIGDVALADKRVLDIGCGAGLKTLLYFIAGATYVEGVDISQDVIDAFKALLKAIGLDDTGVRPCNYDWIQVAPGSEKFDVIFVNEAISHIRDTEILLKKINKTLNIGGHLIIQDDNNKFCLPSYLKCRNNWWRSELGPIHNGMVEKGRIFDKLPFREARKLIIKENFPDFTENHIAFYAKATQGLWGSEITDSINHHIENAVVERPKFKFRNPYTGEFPELALNPLWIKKYLSDMGFSVALLPPNYITRGVGVKQLIKRALSSQNLPSFVTLFLSPKFLIHAQKINN